MKKNLSDRRHPMLEGKTFGMVSGENPAFDGRLSGHDTLGKRISEMGLAGEPIEGHYGGKPERSWLVQNPTREQMTTLGKDFGQESVIHSSAGDHRLIYTNGQDEGTYHPGLPGVKVHDVPPHDNFSKVPGLGYVQLDFDWGAKHPLQFGKTELREQLLRGLMEVEDLAKKEQPSCLHTYSAHGAHFACNRPGIHSAHRASGNKKEGDAHIFIVVNWKHGRCDCGCDGPTCSCKGHRHNTKGKP